LLFQWHSVINGGNIAQYAFDLDSIANFIYRSFIANEDGTMKFEHFVCLYVTLAYPMADEKFDLVFRVFAAQPPEYDEEMKE
jgi:hypothetical protein